LRAMAHATNGKLEFLRVRYARERHPDADTLFSDFRQFEVTDSDLACFEYPVEWMKYFKS
jgi:hypothetical protein